MASNEVNDLLLGNQVLDPKTNLPAESSEVTDVLSLRGESARFMAPSSIQMGLYGPEGRRIGQSKYDINILPEDIMYGGDLELIRSQNQPGWHMLGNALVQSFNEIVGGTMEGIGYITDVNAWGNWLANEEFHFGNAFSEAGKRLKEKGREKHPVHTSFEPGSFSPGNWSWWMSNAPSVSSTLSLLIPSWGATRLVTAGAKGLAKMTRGAKFVDEMDDLVKLGLKGTTRAVFSRQAESMMESSQLYDEIYKENLSKGMNDVEARKNASVAASQVYRRNWAMLLQDIPQYMLLGSKGILPRAAGKSTIGTARAAGKSILPVLQSRTFKYGKDMVGEGLEEAYQYMLQKEGEYTSRLLANPDEEPSTFNERLREYTKDGELWTSAFFGMLGSGAMHVMTGVTDNVIASINMRRLANQLEVDGEPKKPTTRAQRRVDNIKGFATQFSNTYKKLMEAYASGDQDQIVSANIEGRSHMFEGAAINENMNELKEWYREYQDASLEELQKLYPDLSEEALEKSKEDVGDIIREAEEYEKQYDANMRKVEKKALNSIEDGILLTRQEYVLNKLKEHRNVVEQRVNEAKKNIPKYDKVSDNQKIITEYTREKRRLDGVKDKDGNTISTGIIRAREKLLESAPEEEKELLQYSIADAKERSKKLATLIENAEKAKTPEDIENDKQYNITPEMLLDYQDAQGALDRYDRAIEIAEEDIRRIWEGEIDHGKPTDEDISDRLIGVPMEGDYAFHTDPETNEDSNVKVLGIDRNKPDVYTVIDLNENFQPVEDAQPRVVALDNLELNIDMSLAYTHDEPMNADETTTDRRAIDEFYRKRGLRNVSGTLSYVDRGDPGDKIKVRDSALHKWASSPYNDMTNARFEFEIAKDKNNQYTEKFWSLFTNEKIKEMVRSGEALTKEQIETILDTPNEDNFSIHPADFIPIKVRVIDGGNIFERELYYHESSYDNIAIPLDVRIESETNPDAIDEYKRQQKLQTREVRKNILAALLAGRRYALQSNGLETKSPGHPNYADPNKPFRQRNRNLTEVFDKESNELAIWIGDTVGYLSNGTKTLEEYQGTPGAIYAFTTKTANGQEEVVKLNYNRLSEEHALILLEAITKRYTAKSGGSLAELDQNDPRIKLLGVEGLNVGEIIDLLVRFGEKTTSVDYGTNKDDWADNLEQRENKQLYVKTSPGGRAILVFGKNQHPLHGKGLTAFRKKFVQWAMEHKNYAAYRTNPDLEIDSMDRIYEKSFKLGSIENDGTKTYQQLLIENDMVVSDLEEFVDGSLFEGPVIEFDPNTFTESYVNEGKKQPSEEWRRKGKEKKTPQQQQDQVTVEKDVRKSRNLTLDENSQAEITSASDLSNVPAGSLIKVNGWKVVKNKQTGENEWQEVLYNIGKISKNGYLDVDDKLISTKKYYGLDGKHKTEAELWAGLDALAAKVPRKTGRIVAQVPEGFTPEQPAAEPKPTPKPTPKKTIKKEEPKKEEPKEVIKPQPEEQTPPTKNKLPKMPRLGSHGKYQRTYKGHDYEEHNLPKELKKIRSMLGRKVSNDFKLVDDLIYLAQGGRYAFANYHHDGITLYKAAEKGTTYHEAFHRVSLGYLTEDERQKIYEDARKRWSDRLEHANDRETEEFLAEKFREFVLQRGRSNTLVGRIKQFFTRLYNFIKSWFTGPKRLTDGNVDVLFNAIYDGKYRRNSIISDNYELLTRADYWRLTLPSMDTGEKVKKVVKGLTAELLHLNKVEDIAHIDKLDWAALQNNLTALTNQFKELLSKNVDVEGNQLTQESRDQINGWIELYTNILGYNPETKQNENFAKIRELMLAYMKSIGIRTLNNEDVEAEINDKGQVIYDTMAHEFALKNNAQGSVKLVVATAPASPNPDPFSYFDEYVDYNEAWSILLEDLHDKDNVKDMIRTLEEMVNQEERFFYKHILDRLKRPGKKGQLFKNQFEVTMRAHKHNFLNMIIGRTEQGNLTYRFTNANLSAGARVAKLTWSQELYMSNLVDRNKGEIIRGKGTELEKILNLHKAYKEQFNEIKDKPEFLNRQTEFKNRIISLLNRLHIGVDERTLSMYQKTNKLSDKELISSLNKDIDIIANYALKKKSDTSINERYLNRSLDRLSNAHAKAHPENTNDMVLGPANASYYQYTPNSHVTARARLLNRDRVYVNKLLTARGMGNSQILQQLTDPDNFIEINTFAGTFLERTGDRGRDYFDITTVEDYLMKVNAYLQGYIPFPTLAEKRTYYVLGGLNVLPVKKDGIVFDEKGDYVFSDEIVDVFVGYAKDEYDRIQGVKEDIKNKDKLRNRLIENYHYTLTPSGRRDYKNANGLKYHIFPGLSTSEWNEGVVREKIIAGLKRAVKDEFHYAFEIGAIDKSKKNPNLYVPGLMDMNQVNKYGDLFGKEDRDKHTKALVATYAVKAMASNIELYKVFAGDPAFFESREDNVSDDLGKRLGAMVSSGQEMVLKTDYWGEELLKTTFSTATVKTQYLESQYYGDLVQMHTEYYKQQIAEGKIPEMSEEEIKKKVSETLAPYLHIDRSDGQSFVTPEFYRSVSIRIGEWSDIKEEAYNKLISGESDLTDLEVIMQPIKPVYYAQELEDFSGQQVPVTVYDKTSMAPLFRSVVRGTQAEVFLDRMEGKGQFEGKPKIDMLKMDTATKVGNRGQTKLFVDETTQNTIDMKALTNIPTFAQHYNALRRQLATDPHESTSRKLGTQFVKVGMANIDLTAEYGDKTGAELANEINLGLGTLSKLGADILKGKLGFADNKVSNELMIEELRKEAEMAGLPRSIIDSIKIDETTGEMHLQFDSMPNRLWYQSRLIALVNKYIIDRNFPGGQFIQISNLGLKKGDLEVKKAGNLNELEFIRLDEKTGKLKPMQALVSVSMFKNHIPGYDNMTWQEKVDYIKKHDLDMLGYRIPTQGQNSTVALSVGGILPEAAGDAVVLPSEFTTLTGSDFDIDKFFLVRPNYTMRDGKMVEIKYLRGDKFQEQYSRMMWHKFGKHLNDVSDDFLEWYLDEGYDLLERNREARAYQETKEADILAVDEMLDSLRSKRSTATGDDKIRISREIAWYIDQRNRLLGFEKDEYNPFNLAPTSQQMIALKDRVEKEMVKIGVLPKLDDFKELSEMDRNTPKAIQNLILSNYKRILTSDRHVVNTTAPLGGLQTKLEVLAGEAKALDKKAAKFGMFSLVSLKSQNMAKARYASGKFGVPPFALHNVNHVLTQLSGVEMPGRISELQVGNGNMISLSGKIGTDGFSIIDWLSALIDAHVDLPTNPFILDLNINKYTYDVLGYLIRSGVGEASFDFLAQPAIKSASEEWLKRSGSKIQRDFSKPKALRTAKTKILNRLGHNKMNEENQKALLLEIEGYKKRLLTKEGLERKVLEQKIDLSSKEGLMIQVAVLDKLTDIRDKANTLSNLVQGSQVDTAGYGSNLPEYKVFMKRARNALTDFYAGRITNIDKIIPTDDQVKEGDMFTTHYFINGANFINTLFENQTIMASPTFGAIVDKMTDALEFTKANDTHAISTVYNEAFSAIVMKKIIAEPEFFGLNYSSAYNLMFGDNNIYAEFARVMAKYPHLKKNAFLKRLQNVINNKSGLKQFFTFQRGDFSNPWETEDIISAWEDVMNDPVGEINKLGKNLFMYSMLTTGMNSRANSFWNYVPPTAMKGIDVKDRTVSFDDGIKALRKLFNEPSDVQEYIDVIQDVFVHNSDLRRNITADNENTRVKSGTHNTINPVSRDLYLGDNHVGEPVYLPYVTFHGKVYKYAGYYINTKGFQQPIYRQINKKGYREGGRTLVEYGLEKSMLSDNYARHTIKGDVIEQDFIEDTFKASMATRYGDSFVYMSDGDIFFSELIEPEVEAELEQEVNKITDEPVITEDEGVSKEDKTPTGIIRADRVMAMKFKDGTGGRKMRPEFAGKSTMDLILSGDRVATSRAPGQIDDLKAGEIVKFFDDEGRVVYVTAVTDAYALEDLLADGHADRVAERAWTIEESAKADQGTLTGEEYEDIEARSWSILEGWDQSMFQDRRRRNFVQFQFELLKEITPDATQQKLFTVPESTQEGPNLNYTTEEQKEIGKDKNKECNK
jgi:hypothetical protein